LVISVRFGHFQSPAVLPWGKEMWIPTELEFWVDSRADLDAMEERKISGLCRDSNSRYFNP